MRTEYQDVPLGKIAKLWDCLHKTPSYAEEGYSMIRVTDIRRGFLNLTGTLKVRNETYQEFVKRYKPKVGDIIFTRVGSYGNSCFVNRNLDFCLGQNTVCIEPNHNSVVPFHLYSCLNSPYVKRQIDSVVGGASQPTISLKSISLLRIPLPNIEVQRKIAAILSAYDDLIENNLRRIKILEEMAQNLYREWFVKFRFPGHEQAKFVDSPLGMIPEGWEVKAFSDEVDILSGGTPSTTVPEYWNGEIPWMTPKDIQCSIYVMDTERKITSTGLNKCSSALYPAETIFITARGTVGRCVLAAQPMAMSQTSYALIGRNHNPQHYVYLMTLELVESLKKAATGAVFDTIIVDTFKRQYVAFPPLDLRIQVANQASACFGFIKNLLRRNTNLRRTRDLLLPKLISGEVDVSAVDIAVPLEAEP